MPGSKDRLWFRGIKNLDAAIAWALERGLGNATEVVITGENPNSKPKPKPNPKPQTLTLNPKP